MLDKKIKHALDEIKKGNPIILTDDDKREQEGDLVYAATLINEEKINFMLKYGSGIICLSIDENRARKLKLRQMVKNNKSAFLTPFTISIEAKQGITTGVSAKDRATTIIAATNDDALPEDIVTPGHVFPLLSNPQGVFGRLGHTEGSLDIVKLAGFAQGAVLSELMNTDGTMMNSQQIHSFSRKHKIPVIAIAELIQYRRLHEMHIEKTAESPIHLSCGKNFLLSHFKNTLTHQCFIVLHKPTKKTIPLVRIHSACFTGDLLGSLFCDCQSQLQQALNLVNQEGGYIIYMLDQEGRGIGLENKIKAYALQQKQAVNTLQANALLGFDKDLRNYDDAAQYLKREGVKICRLLSNNPDKISTLEQFGIKVHRIPTCCSVNSFNRDYLSIKKTALNHMIEGINTNET